MRSLTLPAAALTVAIAAGCSMDHCWRIRETEERYVDIENGCGILVTGEVDCWGATGPSKSGPYVSLSAGSSFMCGLRGDGSVHCWDIVDVTEGVEDHPGPFGKIAGDCGLTPEGTVECWGTSSGLAVPSEPLVSVSRIDDVFCGLRPDARAMCWEGSEVFQTPNVPLKSVQLAKHSLGLAFGLTLDGGLLQWDARTGPYDPDAPTGPDVPGSLTAFDSWAGNGCGIGEDQAIHCWGDWSFYGDESFLDTNLCSELPDTPGPSAYETIDVQGKSACVTQLDGPTICFGSESTLSNAAPP